MGKKKRQFIDKKNAHSYRVVHRSQKDPLQADEESSAYVLQPFQSKKGAAEASKDEELDFDPQDVLAEQRKFGIYYDDGYNYLQHLRDPDADAMVELEETMTANKHKHDPIQVSENLKLPGSVFPSEAEEAIGMLNLAAPRPGPRLDMDPDIVETLDEDFESFVDAENPDDFEDDFVLLANGGEVPDPDAVLDGDAAAEDNEDDWEDMDTDEEEDGDDDDDDDEEEGSDGDYDPDSDARSDVAVGDVYNDAYHRMQLGLDDVDDGRSRFSGYSVTSAVLPRNEGLKLLDARFEEELRRWDEDEYEPGTHAHTLPPERVQQMLEEFKESCCNRPQLEALLTSDSTKDTEEYRRAMAAIIEKFRFEKSDGEEEPEELEMVTVRAKPQFDVMSIRSTSTVGRRRNMPAIIPNPVKEKKKGSQSAQAGGSTTDVAAAAAPTPVVLDKKTGLPAGILHEKPKKTVEMDEDVEAPPPLCCERRRDETREEKKLRKQATKEHRRDRRVEKKANKQHFVHKHQAESLASKAVEGIRM